MRGPWRSFEAVEFATLEWVDWFNNRRLRKFVAENFGVFALLEMAFFIIVLLVGLIYAWKKGALEWE